MQPEIRIPSAREHDVQMLGSACDEPPQRLEHALGGDGVEVVDHKVEGLVDSRKGAKERLQRRFARSHERVAEVERLSDRRRRGSPEHPGVGERHPGRAVVRPATREPGQQQHGLAETGGRRQQRERRLARLVECVDQPATTNDVRRQAGPPQARNGCALTFDERDGKLSWQCWKCLAHSRELRISVARHSRVRARVLARRVASRPDRCWPNP